MGSRATLGSGWGPNTATAPATPATSGACGCTWSRSLHGLPIGYALTRAKADERQVLLELLDADPALAAGRPGQVLIADKNRYGRDFEATLADAGIELLRRARKGDPNAPAGASLSRFARPSTPSSTRSRASLISSTTAATPPTGVLVRVLQRLLPLIAAIWHNDHTGQTVRRSLLACD